MSMVTERDMVFSTDHEHHEHHEDHEHLVPDHHEDHESMGRPNELSWQDRG